MTTQMEKYTTAYAAALTFSEIFNSIVMDNITTGTDLAIVAAELRVFAENIKSKVDPLTEALPIDTIMEIVQSTITPLQGISMVLDVLTEYNKSQHTVSAKTRLFLVEFYFSLMDKDQKNSEDEENFMSSSFLN